MTRRRLLGLALWASATAAATLVSFAIVSAVTSHVITADLSTPAAAAAGVAGPAVGANGVALDATPTTTVAEPTSTSTTLPSRSAASSTPTTAPVTELEPAPRRTATTSQPPRPSSRTRTYSVRGGILTVTCFGRDIRLDSATPAERYRVEVRDDGPDRVEVIFRGDRDGTHVEVRCENGEPVARVEPLEGGGSGPGDGTFDGHR